MICAGYHISLRSELPQVTVQGGSCLDLPIAYMNGVLGDQPVVFAIIVEELFRF